MVFYIWRFTIQKVTDTGQTQADKLELLLPSHKYSLRLVATRANTLISLLIRFFDAGQWSHIAFILSSPDGSVVYESRERIGVRSTPLLEWDIPHEFAVIEYELSILQFNRCVNLAKEHLGKKYDYLGVLTFLFPLRRWLFPTNWQDRLFCSEYSGLVLGSMLNVSPIPFPSPNRFWYFWSGYKFKELKGDFMKDDTQANQNTDIEFAPLLLDVISQHNLDETSIKREVVQFEEAPELQSESRFVDLASLMGIMTVVNKLLSNVPDQIVEGIYHNHVKQRIPAEVDTMIGFIWGFGDGIDFNNIAGIGASTAPVAVPTVGVSEVDAPISSSLLGLIERTGLDRNVVESPIVNFHAIEAAQTRSVDLESVMSFITNANDMMYGIPKIAVFNVYVDYVRPRLPKEVSQLLDFLWLQRAELLTKLGLDFPNDDLVETQPLDSSEAQDSTSE